MSESLKRLLIAGGIAAAVIVWGLVEIVTQRRADRKVHRGK